MSVRRLVVPVLLLVGGCGPAATHPGAAAHAAIGNPAPSGAIATEDDYNSARPEYDALPVGASDRAGGGAVVPP
jgi:hypothetical protein